MRTVDILYVYLYASSVYLCLFACCVFMGLAAWNKMDDDDDDDYNIKIGVRNSELCFVLQRFIAAHTRAHSSKRD